MSYLSLYPIGLIMSILLVLVSWNFVKKFSYSVDDEEAEQFKKPFHFSFWISIFIASIIFLAAFSILGFKISAMLKV